MLRFVAVTTLQHEISMPRYCYECVNKATGARHCLVCGSEEESHLLLCNSCPRAYHTSCLTPPLAKVTLINSVADPGSGCLFDPWILDGKKIRIRFRDEQVEQPGSCFLELRNNFWVKKLKIFDAEPGSGINIPDPLHC
jgi:hypothetical protein